MTNPYEFSLPGKVETEETSERQLERAREFANQYIGVIEIALGKKSLTESEINAFSPENKIFHEAMLSFRDKQVKLQEEKKLDAKGFLEQVHSFKSGEKHEVVEDVSNYRLEELSPGFYGVIIESRAFSKLMRGAQGVAAKVRNGISFILIPEYTDNPDFQKRILEENLPHETHHLIWDEAVRSGVFQSGEVDLDFGKSFMTFQDELVARASSEGGLGGYTHILKLSPEERDELEKAYPGKAQAIIDRVSSLNHYLFTLNVVAGQSSRAMKKDLLQTIIQAKTFDELEEGLRKMQTLIEKFPKKEKQIEGGSEILNIET